VLGIVRVVESPEVENCEVTAGSGATYQLQSEVIWDGKAGLDIRGARLIARVCGGPLTIYLAGKRR
jgi:hypothetical protein